MRWYWIIIPVLMLAFFGLGYGYFVPQQRIALPLDTNDRESFWGERIQHGGAVRAYREFKESVSGLPPIQQHEEAHLFGGALFEMIGIDGFSVCDGDFRYGCFHEFIGRAIAELGSHAIVEAEAVCQQAADGDVLACQHGIGHGIVTASGYTYDDLVDALDTCATLPDHDPIGGCFGGVFMEYNLLSMISDGDVVRAYSDNPFEPCDKLEPAYQQACYFALPQWWERTVLRGVTRQFVHMGTWCGSVDTFINKIACFRGIGTIVPSMANFVVDKSINACVDAAQGNDARLLVCQSMAADQFRVTTDTDVRALCNAFATSAKAYCMGDYSETIPQEERFRGL